MFFKNLHEDGQTKNERAEVYFKKLQNVVYRHADRFFLVLMPLLWIALKIWAVFFFYSNFESEKHAGVWQTIFIGGLITFPAFFFIFAYRQSSGERRNFAARAIRDDSRSIYFETVVAQMTEGFLLLEPENLAVIECNDALSKMLGYRSVEEVKTLDAFDLDCGDKNEIIEMSRIVAAESKQLSAERKFRKKDGSTISVSITGRFISYRAGKAFCLNVRDISESKRAAIEAKRLALVAEKTQNAVIITDSDGKVSWVNEGFTKITEYLPEEILGKKPGQILQGEKTDPQTVEKIRASLRARVPFTGEIYNYSKTGRGYWLSLSIAPIYSKAGVFKGFTAIETDITERKNIEEALRVSQAELEIRVAERTAELLNANNSLQKEIFERKRFQNELHAARQFLRKVIDSVPNPISVKDCEGRFTLANDALAKIYGACPEDLIGKTDGDFVKDALELERLKSDDRDVFETLEEKLIYDDKLTDSSGVTHWLQTVKRPLFLDESEKLILTISTDLTERRILESRLHHAQKLKSIGNLAAGIAREISTPTQHLNDNTRFLGDAFADIHNVLDKYRDLFGHVKRGEIDSEFLKNIDEEIEIADLEYLVVEIPKAVRQSAECVAKIVKIVESMKYFAHPVSLEKKAVDINKAIETTITVARNEWKYVANVETEFDETLPPVPCFVSEFNQVVLNMVINAAHSISGVVGDGSRGKGNIKITTRKMNEDWAEVRISDDGRGIPVEFQNRIFDPLFSGEDTKNGAAQELAISHTVVVEKHNGHLNFETEEGRGTTFIIQLPLTAAENSIRQ